MANLLIFLRLMSVKKYDLIIVGAGPAGCACAYALRHQLIKIALLDKAEFPRDKICGDALSADVVNQLYWLDNALGESFELWGEKIGSRGVRFYAPNGNNIELDFINQKHGKEAGYVSKRVEFDFFLLSKVLQLPNVDFYPNAPVKSVVNSTTEVEVHTNETIFTAPMVIGADGAHSVVNKSLGRVKVEKDHYCAGLRQYYKGVTGFHANHHIELHFYKELLPGYFWIFPLPNGLANVGLGMLSSEVSKRQLNLKEKLAEIIQNHPNVKNRFANATALEEVKGFGLPIGSKKRPISGDRFLLLGDAASLIDPFTGEGIGNAIRSGRLAAEHIEQCRAENRYDAAFNRKYDKIVYQKMWNELRLSRSLQKLLRYPRLFNFVVNKANKNPSVKLLITAMLDNVDLKKELVKPSFYFQLLFR